jgi:hypothetical protein
LSAYTFYPFASPLEKATTGTYQMHVSLSIFEVHKCDPPELQHTIMEAYLSQKQKAFDYSFWTDGSIIDNRYASAACPLLLEYTLAVWAGSTILVAISVVILAKLSLTFSQLAQTLPLIVILMVSPLIL